MNSNVLRFIAFFITLLLVSILIIMAKTNFSLSQVNPSDIKIYFSNEVKIESRETYKNGIGCYISVNANEVNNIIENYNYDGISFNTNLNTKDILTKFNAKVVDNQTININGENKTIIYAYTQKIDKFVISNGKKINLQIAVNADDNEVGIPLLLGSY